MACLNAPKKYKALYYENENAVMITSSIKLSRDYTLKILWALLSTIPVVQEFSRIKHSKTSSIISSVETKTNN